MPAVLPGSLIVVTGVSGFGSHIALCALQSGLCVRGTVRSLEKARQLPTALEKQGADISKLEVVLLDDLTSEAQCEKVLTGVDGVIHVALPGDYPTRVRDSIEANLALLRVAAKHTSIKRVVSTSSSAAVIFEPDEVDHTSTGDDWNETGIKR